jgi:drug/metabolite transporter (DMT)-like permease
MTAPAQVSSDRAVVRAVLSLVAGAVIISFAPVFVLTSGVGPTVSAFWRMVVGGVTLTAIALLSPRVRWPSRRGLLLTLAAAACFCADLMSWHRSIHWIGAGLATILVNFQVFVLAAFGILVLRERVSWRLAVAIPLALAGLFLLVGLTWNDLGNTHRSGVLLGLVAAACYAGYLLLLRATQRDSSSSVVATVAVLSLGCAVILGVAGWLQGESFALPDAGGVGVLVAYGLGPQVLGWLLITRGLAVVKASRAGLILLLQPALAFVWDMSLFGRATTSVELVGAVLALSAIYLGSVPESRRRAEGAAGGDSGQRTRA